MIGNEPPDFKDSIIPWMAKTMKHVDILISTRLSKEGIPLSRKQVVVMKILDQQGPLPQQNLAFITERDKASLTRLLTSMENKNLVARIPSPDDKRINLVHLTKTGMEVLKITNPVLKVILKQLQEGINKKEKELVIDVMKRVQANIKKHE